MKIETVRALTGIIWIVVLVIVSLPYEFFPLVAIMGGCTIWGIIMYIALPKEKEYVSLAEYNKRKKYYDGLMKEV